METPSLQSIGLAEQPATECRYDRASCAFCQQPIARAWYKGAPSAYWHHEGSGSQACADRLHWATPVDLHNVAHLEAAVIHAALERRRSYLRTGDEYHEYNTALDDAIDALLHEREG